MPAFSRPGSAGLVTLAAVLVPDLRPLSVGEIIDVAIKIWRRNLATLARIVFVVVAPVEILSALIQASVSTGEIEKFDAAGNTTINTGAAAAWAAGMLTAQLLSSVAFLIASAAVLRAVSVAYLGGTPDWRESLRAATGRLRSLLWLGFLMFGGLVLSAVALILPAIWLGTAWALAFPVLIAEGQRGTNALGRSFRLVQGRWWPTFGALFLAFLFQLILGMILGIPLGIVTYALDSNSIVTLVLATVINVVSSVITTPFMAAVLILIYFDLRVRKEGFDLQLLSQGVGMEGAVVPAQAPWLAGAGNQWAPQTGQWAPQGGQWGNQGGWQWGPQGWQWSGASPPGYEGWEWGPQGWQWTGASPPGYEGWQWGPQGWQWTGGQGGGAGEAWPAPTGPPAPRFDEPIDPTGPDQPVEPTGPGAEPTPPGDPEQ